MPELPEVETVRTVLNSKLTGLEIEDIDVRYAPIVGNDIEEFKKKLLHRRITDIRRLGKYLIFVLDEGNLISHLRMEGKYFYVPKNSMDNKHIHVIFYLSDGYMLCYQDVRKFGRMLYKENEELYTTKPLSEVGIDPILSKEIEISGIYDKIKRKNIPIKTVLLDQSVLCGLGNIYVDEVLYQAHILPLRISNTLTYEEVEEIVGASVRILSRAIEYKGTTIRSYTSALGVEGSYQQFLMVHTKKECPCCNTAIAKIKVGGRGTYYCKNCQR